MMTEKEKQEQIEATNASIARNTVIAAMAASILSPTLANAQTQTAEQSAEFSATAVEQTVSDIPSQAGIMSEEEFKRQPALGSEAWMAENLNTGDVKTDIATYAAGAYEEAANISVESVQEDEKERQQVMEKYNTPLTFSGSEVSTNVGKLDERMFDEDLGISSLGVNREDMTLSADLVASPHKAIDRNKIERVDEVGTNQAVYRPAYNDIQVKLPDSALSDNIRDKDFNAGSHVAEYFTVLHESTHKRHDEKVGLSNVTDTNEDRLKKNRLTETLANATEYLAAAQLYQDCKNRGMTTVQDTRVDENGEKSVVEVPVERFLDYYPGLKEVVTSKDNFDLSNPEDKRAVVEASSKWWHAERMQGYDEQATNALLGKRTITQEFDAVDKDVEHVPYDEQAKAMMKDIYVGGNHPLMDLTDCADLLDTMTNERAQELVKESGNSISSGLPKETVKELDQYLISLGLENSQDKADFLEQCYDDITHRRNTDDETTMTIKNILLKNGGEITYADGMVETRLPNSDLATIREAGGKNYVVNADVDFEARRNQQELAQTKENTVSQKNGNNGLSVQQMLQMKNQRGM